MAARLKNKFAANIKAVIGYKEKRNVSEAIFFRSGTKSGFKRLIKMSGISGESINHRSNQNGFSNLLYFEHLIFV